MPDAEAESELLLTAIRAQVEAYDARYLKASSEASSPASPSVQAQAYGRRDATGIESVHDLMPTEQATFERLVEKAASSNSAGSLPAEHPVTVLDFGCGDGRYLQQYLRSSRQVSERHRRPLWVVAYDVSAEALRSFHVRAMHAGLVFTDQDPTPSAPSSAGLHPLADQQLRIQFVQGDATSSAVEVLEMLRHSQPVYDVAVFGWGTLSSIPRLKSLSPEGLLAAVATIASSVMNVVSSTNNHVRFQRIYEARRRAFSQTDNEALRAWLQPRIGLASFPGSYYYQVDTGEQMFYAAVTPEQEVERLAAAGFSQVELHICNIINFFDIQTKPRAARLNHAVIRLLERCDAWGAQLLLAKAVARAFDRPLSSLRTDSCVFDASSRSALQGQVARYFISVGVSTMCPGES